MFATSRPPSTVSTRRPASTALLPGHCALSCANSRTRRITCRRFVSCTRVVGIGRPRGHSTYLFISIVCVCFHTYCRKLWDSQSLTDCVTAHHRVTIKYYYTCQRWAVIELRHGDDFYEEDAVALPARTRLSSDQRRGVNQVINQYYLCSNYCIFVLLCSSLWKYTLHLSTETYCTRYYSAGLLPFRP